jgi:excisionase family DNA binding protein
MNNLDTLLSAQELADYLEVPIATIYSWRHRGEGPPGFRAGKHLRFRWADVERWITARISEHTG